jgi:peptidoglycan/LPS O-acetylase OafA/YrhL
LLPKFSQQERPAQTLTKSPPWQKIIFILQNIYLQEKSSALNFHQIKNYDAIYSHLTSHKNIKPIFLFPEFSLRLRKNLIFMKRNPNIQGLRGALSMLLFFYHVVQSRLPTFENQTAQNINHIFRSFEYGVEIFFGVSGIVIFFTFKKYETIWSFITSRVLRIFPVLWVTIFTIVILSNFSETHRPVKDPFTIIVNLLAAQPIFSIKSIHPAAWSISYEFAFYSIFVFFSCLSLISNKIIATTASIVLITLIIATHLRMLPFLIGFFIAKIFDNTNISEKIRAAPWPFLSCAGIFIIISMLAWQASYDTMPHSYKNSSDLFKYPAALAYYLIAAASVSFALVGVYLGKGFFHTCCAHLYFNG